MTTPAAGSGGGTGAPRPADHRIRNRNLLLAAIFVLVGGGIGVGVAFATRSDDATAATTTVSPSTTETTSSTTAGTTTSSTTTEPGAPEILSFSGPSTVDCSSESTVQITLSWKTANTTSVALSVDDQGLSGTYGPNDAADLDFPCDGASHSYTIAAQADGENEATRSKNITPA